MTVGIRIHMAGETLPSEVTGGSVFAHRPSLVDQGPKRAEGFSLTDNGGADDSGSIPVECHTIVAEQNDAKAGVFLAAFVRRKPGMSVADFRTYSLKVHAAMDARMPALLRYEQYHPISENSVFDCLSLFHFADMAALEAALASDVVTAGTADLINFIDPAASLVLVTTRLN